MVRVHIGVAGVGVMGKRHAENLARLVPGARLVAVADADAERARQVATELGTDHSYSSLEALLAHHGLDAVVIVSPGKVHARNVEMAAAAGKGIFCEKPLATSLADADRALEAVRRAGVRLQVGHMRRYDPAYADAKHRIEAGEIGEPVIFKSIGRDQECPSPLYFQQGNAMLFLDSSIHDFDLARWLMADEVDEVHAFGSGRMPEVAPYNDLEAGVVNLRFEQGAVGNVESFRQCRYGYDIRTEVVGTKGTLMIGSLRQTATTVMTKTGIVHDAVTHWLERFSDAYLAEMRAFVRTLLADGQPQVTGKDGRAAVAMSLAAERSYREKRPVKLEEMESAKATPIAL
jgi:scyllo-inositol 2-dehydrogenase (NAD+)